MKYLDEIELLLVKSMKIAYMTGKGNNHLLPVFIPRDTISAIKKIPDPKFRAEAGVTPNNKFLFASVQGSEEGHLSGWHAVHEICTNLVLKNPKPIIATNNPHRISTIFASLHMPEKDCAHMDGAFRRVKQKYISNTTCHSGNYKSGQTFAGHR